MASGYTGVKRLAREHPEYTATHYLGFPFHAHVDEHSQTIALLQKIATAA